MQGNAPQTICYSRLLAHIAHGAIGIFFRFVSVSASTSSLPKLTDRALLVAEDEEQNFKIYPYHSSGLECPDLSTSSAMVALSVEALEQLATALLVAAIRPQIRSLRLLLPSKIAASSPPLSSWPESFASSIALLSTAASTVIHLLQHV